MKYYQLVASLLCDPKDPEIGDKKVIVGLMLQEINDEVSRKTVFEPIEETPEGHTMTIRQVREDGLVDFVWGCRVDLPLGPVSYPRFSVRSPLEMAVAALAKMLILDPPPAEVMARLAEAEIGVSGATWSGWLDPRKADGCVFKPVI